MKHHLQQASKAFFANRWILTDHQVSIATRLKYFDKVVGTVASFAAGHRALYTNDLLNMDVSYRKLCRQIVGPPPGTNWSLNWHDFFFRLFDRRMFRSKDCFTGRFPGIEHDASHLYTGGSGCAEERAKSKPVLRRGLKVWCSGRGW